MLPDETLRAALARHEVLLPDDRVALLESYAQLLWQWNTRMNLTRHTDFDRFVSRDIVDALQIAYLLSDQEEVLDVGTGGGLPGIVLKILRPSLQVSLLDQTEKKVLALQSMIQELKLSIPFFRSRIQDHLVDHQHQTLVVRAVAPMPKLLGWLSEHWGRFFRLLVVKGPAWKDECAEAGRQGLTKRLDIHRAASYPLAGTESESVILEVATKGRLSTRSF